MKNYTKEQLYEYGMRDIPNFEGLYAITSCGKVWSYKSKMFLKSYSNGNGYQKLTLYKNSKPYQKYIHRLLGETYLEKKEGCEEIDHLDKNRANNNINNLEWVSTKENNWRKFDDIYCIENQKYYRSSVEVEKDLGCSHSDVSKCLRKERISALGYHFLYAKDVCEKNIKETLSRTRKKTIVGAKGCYCYSNNKWYYSASEAARQLKVSVSSVSQCCTEKKDSVKGLRFCHMTREDYQNVLVTQLLETVFGGEEVEPEIEVSVNGIELDTFLKTPLGLCLSAEAAAREVMANV